MLEVTPYQYLSDQPENVLLQILISKLCCISDASCEFCPPDPAGHEGEFLSSDGTDFQWDVTPVSAPLNQLVYGTGASIASSSNLTFNGTTTLALSTSAAIFNLGGGATAAELRFLEPSASGVNYSAFKAVAQSANITYSLPPTVGAAGTFLRDAAGDGVLTWAVPTFTLTNGSGTTANGTAVDLGGTLTVDANIDGGGTASFNATNLVNFSLIGVGAGDCAITSNRDLNLTAGLGKDITLNAGADITLTSGDDINLIPTDKVNVSTFTGGGTQMVTVDNAGDLGVGTLPASGVWTPTITASTNTDAGVTATDGHYMRVGSEVSGSFRFTADPTLAATTTSFEFSLPIASNIGAAADLGGVAFCGSIAGMGAEAIGVAANNTGIVFWKSSDIGSQTWTVNFMYRII